MVTPRYPPNVCGGGEISCKLLVDSLRKYTGHTVDVVSFDKIFPRVRSKAVLNYKAYDILKSRINDYDIFHTYNMDLLPVVGYLTKKYDICSVGTFNGRIYSLSLSYFNNKYLHPKFYIKRYLLSSCINFVKEKVFLSPFEAMMWGNDGITSTQVITNMLDESFKPGVRNRSGGKVRVLFVGNKDSSHTRGLEVFLSIYDRLGSDVELVIVGKGWDVFLDGFNTRNKVNYMGFVPNKELAGVYSCCDIFYHAKFFEPVPIERVVIEAMQAGLCVVSIGSDVLSPIIQDGVSGVLVDLDDFNDDRIFRVFSDLVNNMGKVRLLGENAKRRVYEVCSPENIVGEYEEIYERCSK